ncbi:MAG: hypothetical protein Q8Q60_01935 [Candidatus Chromulinivorax sp.]|nr:hypothetical protein [Candidatus Chromulinivorax sp.]
MKFLQKVTMFAILLISGLQLSAKNKERILVINECGSDILVRTFNSGVAVNSKIIKKRGSSCIAASNLEKIGVSKNKIWLKGYYQEMAKINADNIVVVTKNKKSKDTLSIKVYRDHAAFIAANPDYIFNNKVQCPSVLP